MADNTLRRPLDRVNQYFHADRPNPLWVSAFTGWMHWSKHFYFNQIAASITATVQWLESGPSTNCLQARKIKKSLINALPRTILKASRTAQA